MIKALPEISPFASTVPAASAAAVVAGSVYKSFGKDKDKGIVTDKIKINNKLVDRSKEDFASKKTGESRDVEEGPGNGRTTYEPHANTIAAEY